MQLVTVATAKQYEPCVALVSVPNVIGTQRAAGGVSAAPAHSLSATQAMHEVRLARLVVVQALVAGLHELAPQAVSLAAVQATQAPVLVLQAFVSAKRVQSSSVVQAASQVFAAAVVVRLQVGVAGAEQSVSARQGTQVPVDVLQTAMPPQSSEARHATQLFLFGSQTGVSCGHTRPQGRAVVVGIADVPPLALLPPPSVSLPPSPPCPLVPPLPAVELSVQLALALQSVARFVQAVARTARAREPIAYRSRLGIVMRRQRD